jgi:hypothetical protein
VTGGAASSAFGIVSPLEVRGDLFAALVAAYSNFHYIAWPLRLSIIPEALVPRLQGLPLL